MSIVKFPVADAAKDPNVVLEEAKDQFESLVIIGWNRDETLDARATLNLTASDINWLIDVFKQKLLMGDYSE